MGGKELEAEDPTGRFELAKGAAHTDDLRVVGLRPCRNIASRTSLSVKWAPPL
jgi:hypothetical protein